MVLNAIAPAKQLAWIDADRLYVCGFSRGAVVASRSAGKSNNPVLFGRKTI
jgi:predicted peptidase